MQDISISKINTPEKVNQLSCGMGHIICKTILKRVYTWGKNESGQLGTGDNC
jgi:alpha-tubulin suppressor-like RCC1 family protein